jgi:rod shape-determining protein MreD
LIALQAVAALLVATVVHLVGAQLGTVLPRLLDPFLLATVWVALRTGPMAGQLTGLAAGLLHDGLTGGLFGLTSLANTLVGYVTAAASSHILLQQGIRVLLYGLGALVQQLTLVLVVLFLVPSPELPQVGWMLAKVGVSIAAGALLAVLEGGLNQRWGAWSRRRARRLRFKT